MSLISTGEPRAPILVLTIGNPSRGDDAFGPVLAGMLQDWLAAKTPAVQQAIELISEQQLMVEHAMDLAGRQHVLFVDAAAQGDEPVALTPLSAPPPDASLNPFDSHRSSPAQLLSLCEAVLGTTPPPAELLTLTGSSFELDTPLSARAQAHLPQAWSLLQSWLDRVLHH